jgi:hypothetical protein
MPCRHCEALRTVKVTRLPGVTLAARSRTAGMSPRAPERLCYRYRNGNVRK